MHKNTDDNQMNTCIYIAGVEAICSLGASARNHPSMLDIFGRHLHLPVSGIDAAYRTPELSPDKASLLQDRLVQALENARPLYIPSTQDKQTDKNSHKNPYKSKKNSKKSGKKSGHGKGKKKGGAKGKRNRHINSHPLMQDMPDHLKSNLINAVQDSEVSDFLYSFEHPLDTVVDELEIAVEACWADLQLQRIDCRGHMHAKAGSHHANCVAEAHMGDSCSSSDGSTHNSDDSSIPGVLDSDNESSEWEFADTETENYERDVDVFDCGGRSDAGPGRERKCTRDLPIATASASPIMLLPSDTGKATVDTMSNSAACVVALRAQPAGMQCMPSAAEYDSQFSDCSGEGEKVVPPAELE